MNVQLNQLIVSAKEKWTSVPRHRSESRSRTAVGSVRSAANSNGVTIDFLDAMDFEPHHCAFHLSEAEFEAALARPDDHDVAFYADNMLKNWARSSIPTAAGAFTSTTPQAICLR